MRRLVPVGVALAVIAGCAGDGGVGTSTTVAGAPGTGAPGTTGAPDTTSAPDTTGAPDTTSAPTTTTSPTTTIPPDPDFTITISGFSFGPQLTVSAGDVIAVTNEDPFPHTWTSTEGLFDSRTLSGGAVFFHSFDEAGEYQFVCSIHPGDMSGSIIVEG